MMLLDGASEERTHRYIEAKYFLLLMLLLHTTLIVLSSNKTKQNNTKICNIIEHSIANK